MSERISTYTLAKSMSILADEIGDHYAEGSEIARQVSRRLIELRRLLELAEQIVTAHHGAAHMLDGFNKRSRPEIDSIFDAIKVELEN
jgi:hypothetical protein